MENDNIFRFILILGFAVVFPIGLYHRLKAHLASREKLNRRAEGLFILTTLRPVAILSILGLLAYAINPEWMSWSSVGLPIWVRWLGVGLVQNRILARLPAARSLSRLQSQRRSPFRAHHAFSI